MKAFTLIKLPLKTERLKDICAQSKIYIRPLQTNISLDNSEAESRDENSEVGYIN